MIIQCSIRFILICSKLPQPGSLSPQQSTKHNCQSIPSSRLSHTVHYPLRLSGHICLMVFSVTISTIITGTEGLFTEILQNIISQTSCCFTISFHDLKPSYIPLTNEKFILFIHTGKIFVIQKHSVNHNILCGKQQNALGILSVTPCTSCLLIIILHTLRHIVMNHISHIGFINPHSKCIRCNNNGSSVVNKIILVLFSDFIIQSCMISGNSNSFFEKQFKKIVYIFSCRAINNPALCWMSVYVIHHKIVFPPDIFHAVI